MHVYSVTHWLQPTFCGQSSPTNPFKIAFSADVLIPVSFLPSGIFPFTLFFSVSWQWKRSYRLWKISANGRGLQWPFEYAGAAASYWPASPRRSSSSYLATWPFDAPPRSWLSLQYAPEEIVAVVLPELQTVLELPLLLYPLLWLLHDLRVESFPKLLLRAVAVWLLAVDVLELIRYSRGRLYWRALLH